MKTLLILIDSLGVTEFCRRAHCSKSTVSLWKKGTRKPGPEMIKRLRKEFGLTVAQIRPDLYE